MFSRINGPVELICKNSWHDQLIFQNEFQFNDVLIQLTLIKYVFCI